MTPWPGSPLHTKEAVAVLAGPTRSVAGFAAAKWNMLSRFTRRYVVLRSCMLEIFEDEHARTPLFSACIAGASLLPIPQKREVQIRVNGYRVCVQWDSAAELRACRAAFEFANRRIEDFYKIVAHRQLGKGRSSEVVFAFDIASGVHVAVKVLSKEASRPTERLFAEREVAVRMTVQHSCIVQTLDIFESPYDLFVVMEFMGGGTLAQRISRLHASIAEDDARVVLARVFAALDYLHGRNIVHRNVKPENVLLDFADESRWAETAKLADLSLACALDDPDAALKVVGTPDFLAPEAATMVHGPDARRQVVFGTEVDMWSAGVTLYNMLSGLLPFDGDDAATVLRHVRSGKFDFPHEQFRGVSDEAKSLIRALLNPDRRKRLTARTALLHPWFSGVVHAPRAKVADPAVAEEYGKLRAAASAVRAIVRMAHGHYVLHMGSFGGRRVTMISGGVDICPMKGRVALQPAEPHLPTSRISNSSTVLSRSSTEETGKRLDMSPLASARKANSDEPASPPRSRAGVFKRAVSFQRVASTGNMTHLRGRPEKEDRRLMGNSGYGSNPGLRMGANARSASLKGAAEWEKMEAKSEKKWRLREAWESRTSQNLGMP